MLPTRAKIVTVVACVGMFDARPADAQMTYVPRSVATPAPEGFFTVPSPAVCRDGTGQTLGSQSLPDGGFVPPSKSLRVDVSNTANPITGFCDWKQNGVTVYTETRYLNAFRITSAGTTN